MEEQTFKFLNKVFMLSAILVAGVLAFFVGEIILQQKSIDNLSNYQITVSGQGKVYAKPDIALVNLGVTAEEKTVVDVTKNNTEKMNAVIDAVKKLGVEDKDIQTTNYNLTPVYDYDVYDYDYAVPMMYPIRKNTTVIGYKLDQNVQVKIRDFTKVGDILAKATSVGANLVGDLQFTIDDIEQYKDQAKAKAIEQAKQNAQNLEKDSGIKLGKLINIYENYNPYPMMYDSKAMGIGGGVSEQAPSPTIQPGQQEIIITVNLTYQVK